MNIKIILLGIVAIYLTSCASSYKQINPHYSDYQKSNNGDVAFNYKYDILKKSGNKKYDKKADQHNIKLVAVEIVNNSEKTIQLGKNYGVFANEKQLTLLSPDESSKKLNQSVAPYIFYMILTPLKLIVTESNGIPKTYSIGYGLAPGLTLINMATAGGANGKMRKELELYNLLSRPIPAGNSVKGIIAFESGDYPALSLQEITIANIAN